MTRIRAYCNKDRDTQKSDASQSPDKCPQALGSKLLKHHDFDQLSTPFLFGCAAHTWTPNADKTWRHDPSSPCPSLTTSTRNPHASEAGTNAMMCTLAEASKSLRGKDLVDGWQPCRIPFDDEKFFFCQKSGVKCCEWISFQQILVYVRRRVGCGWQMLAASLQRPTQDEC